MAVNKDLQAALRRARGTASDTEKYTPSQQTNLSAALERARSGGTGAGYQQAVLDRANAHKAYMDAERVRNDALSRFQQELRAGHGGPVYGRGNIDLMDRPTLRNPDGSVSTVSSMSFGTDKGEVLLPSIGRTRYGYPTRLSEDEAWQHYLDTGENLGTFNSIDEADAYADALHLMQEAVYEGVPGQRDGRITGAERESLQKQIEEYNRTHAPQYLTAANPDVFTPDVITPEKDNGVEEAIRQANREAEVQTPMQPVQETLDYSEVWNPVWEANDRRVAALEAEYQNGIEERNNRAAARVSLMQMDPFADEVVGEGMRHNLLDLAQDDPELMVTINSLTEDQKRNAYYLMGKYYRDNSYYDDQRGEMIQRPGQIPTEVMEYLESLKPEALAQYNQEITEGIEQMSEEHPVVAAGASLFNMNAGAPRAMGQAVYDAAAHQITGRTPDPNSLSYMQQRVATAQRQGVSARAYDDVLEWTGSETLAQGASFLSQTGLDALNSFIISGIPVGGTVMGVSAGADALLNATDRGATPEQALMSGAVQGYLEGFFERYTIGNLRAFKDAENSRQILKQIFFSMASNAWEEGTTEAADRFADYFISGDNSELSQAVAKYMSDGLSEEDAWKKALVDLAGDAALAALGGAISAGLSGGGAGIIREVQIHNTADMEARDLTVEQARHMAGITVDEDLLKKNGVVQQAAIERLQKAQAEITSIADRLEEGEEVSQREKKNAVLAFDKAIDRIAGIASSEENQAAAEEKETKDLQKYMSTGFGAEGEKAFLAMDSNESVDKYRAFAEAYNSGRYGMQMTDRYQGVLTTQELSAAMKAGAQDANKSYPSESVNKLVKSIDQTRLPGVKAGTVKYLGFDKNSLTSQQKLAVAMTEAIVSRVFGVDVEFFQSKAGEGGTYEGFENGSFRTVDGRPTMRFDVNAGMLNESDWTGDISDIKVLFPVISHETTHWMEKAAPQAYKALSDAVLTALANDKAYTRGSTINAVIAAQRAHMDATITDKDGNPIAHTEEDAIHELVAKACEDFLGGDTRVRDALESLDTGTKQTLWGHIKDTFAKIRDFFDRMLGNYKSNSQEAQAIRRSQEELDRIQKLWSDALGVAVAENDFVEGIASDGVTLEGENVMQLSERTYEKTGRQYLTEWLANQEDISQQDRDDIVSQIDKIYDLMQEIKKEKGLKDYRAWASIEERDGKLTVITPNGEYPLNIDYSTVCKKRKALDHILNVMVSSGQLADAKDLAGADVVRLQNIIKSEGLEIACALCFVDSKRYRVGSWADALVEGGYNDKKQWQYGFNELIRSLVPKGSNIQIDEYNYTGREDVTQPKGKLLKDVPDSELDWTFVDKLIKESSSQSWNYALAKAIKESRNLRSLLNSAELLSSVGFDPIKVQNPDLFNIINQKGGSSKPKLSFSEVPYINDILMSDAMTPEAAYAVGGVRIQSFSDFMANMVFDYVQMVGELQAKRLPAHAYTKESSFVMMFGLTGIKINMSLVPAATTWTHEEVDKYLKKFKKGKAREAALEQLKKNAGLDENGNYIWADETFPYEVAMSIQAMPGYAKNCGTIAVGVSDKHIRKLLADPRIHMVIPYHKSNINPTIAAMRNIDLYNNYEPVQNTRFKKTGKKIEHKNEFDFYGSLAETNDPKATAAAYLAWCEENDYIPRFDQFADDPNYYKLLADFRLYDENGEYAPQGPVKGIYPDNMKDLILDGYTYVDENGKKYQNGGLREAQKTSNKLRKKTAEIIRQYNEGDAQHSMRETAEHIALVTEESVAAMRDNGYTAREAAEAVETGGYVQYSLREVPPPKKTITAYKAFYAYDGKLYPPMVANDVEEEQNKGVKGKVSGTLKGLETPVGIWIDADVGALALDDDGKPLRNTYGRLAVRNAKGGGTLAFRPGWHLGLWPDAKQFNVKDPETGKLKSCMPNGLVFAECSVAADYDYQLEALGYGMRENGKFDRTQAGLPRIPTDGYYMYRTNVDPTTAPWIISGAIRVERILDDDMAAEICKKYGIVADPRASHKKIDLADYGLKAGRVTPTKDTDRFRANDAVKANAQALEAALNDPDYANAYVTYPVNFDDPEIIKELARNSQSAEFYKTAQDKYGNQNYAVNDPNDSLLNRDTFAVRAGDAEYSLRDNTGAELSPGQQEYFKDSKVRDEDGNLLRVYHGTYEDFTVFDKNKGRSNMDIQGFFFSPWDIDAEGYGPNVKTVYLNITNPAPEGVAYKALNRFKGQNNAGIKAREYLIGRGYDGVNNGDEEYIAFYPEQIKNIDNLNPTDSEDIRYSQREPVATFYSKLQREIAGYKGEKIGAASVESYLKGKGVKDEEIKWSGIRTFLEGKKSVSKQELMDYLKANELRIEEVTLSDDSDELGVYDEGTKDFYTLDDYMNRVREIAEEDGQTVEFEDMGDYIVETRYNEDGEEDSVSYVDKVQMQQTKWSDFTLDGGANYREILFKLPDSDYQNQAMMTHWGNGRSGVLAHARVQDFGTENGEKVLFIEEIQSDWHNAKMKEITVNNSRVMETTAASGKPLYHLINNKNNIEITRASQSEIDSKNIKDIHSYLVEKVSVPDAPFHESYTDFVLKNLLRAAAEGDYDYLAWTTGKMQEDRWSNEYAEGYRIEYDQDIPKFLKKYGKQWGAGLTEIDLKSAQGEQLAKYQEQYDRLGDILEAEGEGEAEYLHEHLGSLGRLVENVFFTDTDRYQEAENLAESLDWAYDSEIFTARDLTRKQTIAETVPAIPITDSMRDSVLYEGQPMFSQRGDSNDEELAKRIDQAISRYEYRLEKAKAKNDPTNQRIIDVLERQIRDLKQEKNRQRKSEAEMRQKLLRKARKAVREARNNPSLAAEKIRELTEDMDLTSIGMLAKTREKLLEARTKVLELSLEDENYARMYKDSALKAINARLEKQHIKDMDIAQVADLIEQLTVLTHFIENQNKLFRDKQGRDVAMMGRQIVSEMEEVKPLNVYKKINQMMANYVTNNLNPIRAARRLSGYRPGAGLVDLVQNVVEGQGRRLAFEQEADNLFRDFLEDPANADFVKNASKQNIPIKIGNKTAMISPGMRVALYLHNTNKDNQIHISGGMDSDGNILPGGGITVPDPVLYERGQIADAYGRGTRLKLLPTDIDAITAGMTEFEKRYAELLQTFFNETAHNAINETSIELDGIEKAIVDDYFPISVNKDFLAKAYETGNNDPTTEGWGNLKERVENAKNPVLLEDATKVLQRHIANTARYVGLAAPLRDIKKVLGYTATAYQRSVRNAIHNAWDDDAIKYIEKFISDVDSGGRQAETGIGESLRSMYGTSVLTLSPSVALKQVTSYLMAGSLVDMQNLGAGLTTRFTDADREYMDSITPWGWARRQGQSTIEIGDLARQKTLASRLPNWNQTMDVLTTDKLFLACEAQIKQQYPNLKRGDARYDRALADLYNEVLWRTQPQYAEMFRPEYLRRTDIGSRTFGMFKTESMQMAGEMIDAYGRWQAASRRYANGKSDMNRREKSDAAKNFMRTLASWAASNLAFAVAGAAINILLMHKVKPYRDEEGEIAPETLLAKIGQNFASSSVGGFFFASTLFDIASYLYDMAVKHDGTWYDVEVPGISIINDLVQNGGTMAGTLTDEDATAEQRVKAVTKFLLSLSKVTPVGFAENIYNMANSLNLYYQDVRDTLKGESQMYDAGKGLLGLSDTSPTKQQYANRAVAAYNAGDIEKGDRAAAKTSKTQMQKALGAKGEKDQDGKTIEGSKQKDALTKAMGGSSENPAGKVQIYLSAYPDAGEDYNVWKSAGGSDWDFLVHTRNLMNFTGSKRQEQVIAYIKKQTRDTAKQKALWVMAGYQLDSKKDGKTVKDGNFNSKFK